MGEHKRSVARGLSGGLSVVHPRDDSRSSFLAADQRTVAYIDPVDHFHAIPGHALHEKGLQRQKGVVSLFGSQEQSALLVPLINRW